MIDPRLSYRLVLALAACIALLSAGCAMDISGRSNQYSKYDKEKDEFHFLWVAADIVASRAPFDDGKKQITAEQHREIGLGHLENLWKERENVVMIPGPFGPIAFIRKENRLLETVSLFKRDEKNEKFTTNFDLTPIRVQPGEFFVTRQGTLCYSHHCTFPGKTIDEAFGLTLKAINSELEKTSQARIDARKKGEQKRVAWKDLRKELWNGIALGQRYGLVSRLLERFPEALSDESHALLVEQGKKQEIKLLREGMKFTVTMKLAPDDAKEFTAAVEDALRGELPGPSKDVPELNLKQEAKAVEAFRTSKAASDADGKVTMTVEMMPILKLFEEEGGPWGIRRDVSLTEKQLQEARADVAQVETRKMPVNHQLQLETVMEKFYGNGEK